MSIDPKVLDELERVLKNSQALGRGVYIGNEQLAALLAAARDAERLREAIENEPEFPGDMPDEMWEALRSDRKVLTEAFRKTVRVMKRNILDAISRDGGW